MIFSYKLLEKKKEGIRKANLELAKKKAEALKEIAKEKLDKAKK